MATCHSLTNINGELAGDPLDLKMFLATKWVTSLTPHPLTQTLTSHTPPPHTLTQTLEEPPGEDCTRFDTVIPTVVRPPRTPPQYTPPRGLKEGEEEEGECDDELELGILRQFTFSSELQVLRSSHTVNCACPRKLLHVYG